VSTGLPFEVDFDFTFFLIEDEIGTSKNRLPGDGDSFTALLAILIARARSVGNVAYLFV
jgi:hypothetical protein